MHILVGLVSYCLRGSGNGACIQYVTVYSCNWDDGDLVSPPSLSPSPQPRLLQKPHRFLRDPLLRSDPARDGGLDHAVHNRIRPDVRLRLPAGVEEEEEGGGARGGESRVSPVGREVWTDGPPRSLPPANPCPPPAFISERCCSRERLLFLDHLSLTDQTTLGKKKKKKSARTRMLLRGNTTPTPRPSLSPAPTTTTFTTITTTTTILQHQTSLLCLHCYQTPPPRLFSRALWTVRCCQARTERREADGREDFQNKSSSVCSGDVTLQKQQRLKVAVSFFPPSPTLYPYLWCPC